MPTIKQTVIGLALAAGALSLEYAFADRGPNADERSRIESVLRAEGFARWGKIELDDGVWEVGDAYTSDGHKYELKLNPDTLATVRRKPD